MKRIYPQFRLFAALLLLGGGIQAQNFNNPVSYPSMLDNPTLEIDVDETFHDFDPMLTSPDASGKYLNNVPSWGYNIHDSTDNSWLGPTLVWHHGQPQNIVVYNNLDQGNLPTTVHWHGAHVPAKWDGGPHQVIAAGGTWSPVLDTIYDDVCTLWYHPHMEDSTYKQVEMGISGLIYVKDAADTLVDHLPHTYKVDDLPLIIQDRQFKLNTGADSTTSPYLIDTAKNRGPTVIINGVINPYVNIGPQLVRFRILNGSSRQAYFLGLADSATTNQVSFQLTGSDAGYLDAPLSVDTFATGPGIRNEMVVDLTAFANQTIYMINYAPQLASKWGKVVVNGGQGQQPHVDTIMAIRVGNTPLGSNPVLTPIPTDFPDYEKFNISDVSRTRHGLLQGVAGQSGVPYNINGNQFDFDIVNDTVEFDATERWNIRNESDVAHPFHIHDIHFDVVNVMANGDTIPKANWPAEFVGRQDNALIPTGWQMDFITKFDKFGDTLYTGDPVKTAENTYMYHCHILTHEDGYYRANGLDAHGMMQQFIVRIATFPTTGSQQIEELGDNMLFYPNPVQNLLYLQGESKRASEFCIHDLSGKLVRRHELAPFDGVKNFDVSDLQQGMYLVEWRDGKGQSFSKKIVLQR